MGKTLVVGDMHLKQQLILPLVDKAVAATGANRVVFTGDYVDEWEAEDREILDALDLQINWARERKAVGLRLDFLLGNHDWCYLEAMPEHYSHVSIMPQAASRLLALDIKVATTVGGWLATHAGVCASWANKYGVPTGSTKEAANALNTMVGMRAIYSCGRRRGGCELPGPLWADRLELELGAPTGLDQIVGHTPTRTCAVLDTYDEGSHAVGVDTFSLTYDLRPIGDASMLVIDDETGTADRVWTDDETSWERLVADWRAQR